MPRMGRPRTKRKDLPDWLYWNPRRGFYFYRVRDGKTQYEGMGKIAREEAVKRWVKITGHSEIPASDGTVAELIDYYISEVLPEKLAGGDLKKVTADEYRRQAPLLRKEFGDKRYARTPAQSMNPEVLRQFDVTKFVKSFRGRKGAVAANRLIGLLSAVFSAAQGLYCTYNPCLGVERNKEEPRKRPVSQAERDDMAEKAAPAYRLMMRLTEATGMRLTDVRELLIAKCGEREIDLRQSKTGRGQLWEITPAVRAILDEAKTLPGRSRSLFVFPSPKTGKAYSEGGVHYMRRAAMKAAGVTNLHHRDVRKQAVNEAKDLGVNATEFAGHSDPRTTEKHYVNGPRKVKPIR